MGRTKPAQGRNHHDATRIVDRIRKLTERVCRWRDADADRPLDQSSGGSDLAVERKRAVAPAAVRDSREQAVA